MWSDTVAVNGWGGGGEASLRRSEKRGYFWDQTNMK